MDLNKIENILNKNSILDTKLLDHFKTERLSNLNNDVKKYKEDYLKKLVIFNETKKNVDNKTKWAWVLLIILIILIIQLFFFIYKYKLISKLKNLNR